MANQKKDARNRKRV